jgi:hypothetical protein
MVLFRSCMRSSLELQCFNALALVPGVCFGFLGYGVDSVSQLAVADIYKAFVLVMRELPSFVLWRNAISSR